ncbi:unnamed protein product [Protopolystoma xenopodis]|uniref:Uncharacterized protein n=1 Tax=Protopolystoma xenopodis TaxID=117903 RepID=A0A448WA42_9PLAT|nr:unnamed protein product [Protopolystoma xenopodis]
MKLPESKFLTIPTSATSDTSKSADVGISPRFRLPTSLESGLNRLYQTMQQQPKSSTSGDWLTRPKPLGNTTAWDAAYASLLSEYSPSEKPEFNFPLLSKFTIPKQHPQLGKVNSLGSKADFPKWPDTLTRSSIGLEAEYFIPPRAKSSLAVPLSTYQNAPNGCANISACTSNGSWTGSAWLSPLDSYAYTQLTGWIQKLTRKWIQYIKYETKNK